MSSTATTTLERQLVNLRVLSSLKPGQKVSCRQGVFDLTEGKWLGPQSLIRWRNGESREATIMAMSNLLRDIQFAIQNKTYSDTIIDRVKRHIEMAIPGMLNLRLTYAGDARTIASIDVLIENMIEMRPNNNSANSNMNSYVSFTSGEERFMIVDI